MLEFETCTHATLPTAPALAPACSSSRDAKVDVPATAVEVPLLDEVLGEGWRRDDNAHRLGANALMLPELWEGRRFDDGGLAISVLHDAAVFGGRITSRDRSTHHGGQALLTSRGELVDDSFGTMDGDLTWAADVFQSQGEAWRFTGPRDAIRLHGDYFFLGSVHRHFGHVMLEGVSRLWALSVVGAVSRNCRFLVYEPDLEPFARDLLALAGVPTDRLVHAPRSCVVERLFVPRPAMRTHRWITSAMAEIWERMVVECTGGQTPLLQSRRIYLSRRGTSNRPCVNELEVEAMFAGKGFEIVSPETMSVREQIEMAAQAGVLAGAVGSQMYLAAFMPRGSLMLVVAPRNFYLKDDLLLASVRSHKLMVCFGSPVDFSRKKSERLWSVDTDDLRRRVEAGLSAA